MKPHKIDFDGFYLLPLELSLIDSLVEDFLSLYSNYDVVRYSGFSQVNNKEEAVQLLTKYALKTDFFIWIIFSKEN